MNLSKRHKIGGVAIGIALIGLVVDRFVLSRDPADDAAAAPAVAEDLLIRKDSAPPTGASAATSEESGSLTNLLHGIYVYKRLNFNAVPDAFAVPPAWTSAPADLKPVAVVPDWHKKFVSSHRLTGVFVAGRRSQAMLDGKAVLIGQTINGFKLIAVSRTSATFVREGTTALLALDPKLVGLAPSSTARIE